MLVELSDKEVKRIGEIRYGKTQDRKHITISLVALILIIAMMFLDKFIYWIGYEYIVIGIGLSWLGWLYYMFGKSGKAGKEFLKKMQEKI